MRMRLLLLLLLTPLLLRAQQITVNTQTAPVDMLTISDVDFLNTTTPKWLFTIVLTTLPAGQTVDNVVMEVTIDVNLASGEVYENAVYMKTSPLTIAGSRTFTNLDFRSDRALVAQYVTNPTAKKRFEETALPSGTMPAGRYAFRVTLTRNGASAGEGSFAFILTNPSSIELLSPLSGEMTANPFPLFQWMFDGPKSKISIYERLPGQVSLEESATGIPTLVSEIAGSSYQYPSFAARQLVPGKSYVWFVEGIVRISGGTERLIRSDLRSFTVGSGAEPSGYSLLDLLEQALDAKYRPLFDKLREDGLAPAGTIRLDGTPVSVPEFMQIVNELRNRPESVLSLRVE